MAVKKKPVKKQTTKKKTITKPKEQTNGLMAVAEQKMKILKSEIIRDKDFVSDFFGETLSVSESKNSLEYQNLKTKVKSQVRAYDRTLKWISEIEKDREMFSKLTKLGKENTLLIHLESDIKGAMKTNEDMLGFFRIQSYPNQEMANDGLLVIALETENKTFTEILEKIKKLK